MNFLSNLLTYIPHCFPAQEIETSHDKTIINSDVKPKDEQDLYLNCHFNGNVFRQKNPFTKNLYNFRENVLNDKQYLIKRHVVSFFGVAGMGRKNCVVIERLASELIENPVIHVRINQKYHQQYRPSQLFKRIELEIGGQRVMRLDSHQIDILMGIYGLNWSYVDNYMIIPLPLDPFIGKNTFPHYLCKKEIRINIETCESSENIANDYIDKIELGYDLLSFDFKCTINPNGVEIRKSGNFDKKSVSMAIRQIQYTGSESLLMPDNDRSWKIKLYYNHFISHIFFYFTDKNGKIITNRLFDRLELLLNSIPYCRLDYKDATLNALKMVNVNMHGLYCLSFTNAKIQDFEKSLIDFTEPEAMIAFELANVSKEHNNEIYLEMFAINHNILNFSDGGCSLKFDTKHT